MNVATRLTMVALLCGLSLSLSIPADAADAPFVGTWVFNSTQSKLPQGMVPDAVTVTMTDAGGGMYKMTSETRMGANKVQTDVTFGFDGKAYTPLINPSLPPGAPAITQTFERVGANSYKATAKIGGQVAAVVVTEISADGKTMTQTTVGSGQLAALSSVAVFDKK